MILIQVNNSTNKKIQKHKPTNNRCKTAQHLGHEYYKNAKQILSFAAAKVLEAGYSFLAGILNNCLLQEELSHLPS
jgi:hypothetical protein